MKKFILITTILLISYGALYSAPKRETPETQKEKVFIKVKKKDVHIGFGLEFWEAYWDPIWKSFDRIDGYWLLLDPAIIPYNRGTYRILPMYQYNPRLNIRIGNIGVAINIAYGSTVAKMERYFYFPTSGYLYQVKNRRNIKMYDGEVLVNFHLKKILTLFLGPKVRFYTMEEKMPMIVLDTLSYLPYDAPDIFVYNIGGIAGLTLNIPFGKLFELQLRGAGLIFFGKETYTGFTRADTQIIPMGFDAATFFNCKIPPIRGMISIGFRYQYLLYYKGDNWTYRNGYERSYGSTVALKFYF